MTLDGNTGTSDVLLGKTMAGGKYEIRRVLGEGAMGRVYLAWQKQVEREVAIKVLTIKDDQARGRFLEEIRTTSRINHANIIKIHDAGEEVLNAGLPDEHTCLYMVMEYLDGSPLDDYVAKHGTVPVTHGGALFRALPGNEINLIFSEICAGMRELGKFGIIHRDLKPENIFRCHDGRIVILDLGIARVTADSSVSSGATVIDREKTLAGAVLGSLHCMSPEQLRGAAFTDARTDIYAMACVLYFLCMGVCPYEDRADYEPGPMFWVRMHGTHESPTPITVRRSDLTLRLERIIMRGLAPRADDRYQTVEEFYEPFKTRFAFSHELTPPEGIKLDAETLPPPPPVRKSRPVSPIVRVATLLSLLALSAAVMIIVAAKVMNRPTITHAIPTPIPPPSDRPFVDDVPVDVATDASLDVGSDAEADAGTDVVSSDAVRVRMVRDAGTRRRRRCPPAIIENGIIINPCLSP